MNPSGPSDLHTLGYAEQRDEEAIACMTREFNSLAVIFEMPSNTFIEDQRQLVRTSMYYILVFLILCLLSIVFQSFFVSSFWNLNMLQISILLSFLSFISLTVHFLTVFFLVFYEPFSTPSTQSSRSLP